MKTERRHELQTNELALWLAKRVEQIKPYSRLIMLGVLLLVGLIVAWVLLSGRSRNQQAKAWDDLRQLTSGTELSTRFEKKRKKLAADYPDNNIPRQQLLDIQQQVQEEIQGDLAKLADANKGTPAGDWASLRVADAALRQGVDDLFQGSETDAQNELGIAIEHYGRVVEHTSDSMLKQRARLGLAKAYESRGRTAQKGSEKDDLELAKQNYEKLIAEDSVFSGVARQQVKILDSNTFYPWFLARVEERNRPTPTPSPGGTSGGMGLSPFDRPAGSSPLESGGDGSPSFDPLNLRGGASDDSK